jgi:hypothetical protein
LSACGADITASTLVLLPVSGESSSLVPLLEKANKISLGDAGRQADLRSFAEAVRIYVTANQITSLYLKAAQASGKYLAGPAAFKIEGILLCLEKCDVQLIDSRKISDRNRKGKIAYPAGLFAYQRDAYAAALIGLATE